jgi:hypothetical protein
MHNAIDDFGYIDVVIKEGDVERTLKKGKDEKK